MCVAELIYSAEQGLINKCLSFQNNSGWHLIFVLKYWSITVGTKELCSPSDNSDLGTVYKMGPVLAFLTLCPFCKLKDKHVSQVHSRWHSFVTNATNFFIIIRQGEIRFYVIVCVCVWGGVGGGAFFWTFSLEQPWMGDFGENSSFLVGGLNRDFLGTAFDSSDFLGVAFNSRIFFVFLQEDKLPTMGGDTNFLFLVAAALTATILWPSRYCSARSSVSGVHVLFQHYYLRPLHHLCRFQKALS